MRSTSCKDVARELLEQAVAGKAPRKLPAVLVQDACGSALFGTLVEGLADRFEPALADLYARLFSQAIAYVNPDLDPASIVARYERVRRPRPILGKPHTIFVLSRITLGADVAVTSVMLAAAKRRFPHARLVFAGPQKNFELFAADPHLHHAPVEYHRGGLRDRLAIWEELKSLLDTPDSVVIDPDSRLTQLGLLPVAAEDRYHLFESRSYGGDSDRPLPELAADWAAETFGIANVKPFLSLGPLPDRRVGISVNLGVGENVAKRLPDPFEERLFALLAARGVPICADQGASEDEAARVKRAVEKCGAKVALWNGSFAGFARHIAGSALYVGYDSAGQHVAAACGVPLISIFSGFAAPRMFERWRPCGPGCNVIRVDQPNVEEVLGRVEQALISLPA